MKIKNLKFLIFIFIFTYHLSPITYHLYAYAQDNQKLVTLTKQIMEAKSNEELYPLFAELKDIYFSANKYTEFAEFLKSLSRQKDKLEPFTSYYIALARNRQLKYLEEAQKWEEYFSSGNTYREEIAREAERALDLSNPKEPLYLYARLLFWQFHYSQQDASADAALSDLMNASFEYAKSAPDLTPIKEAADQLLVLADKGKSRELYRIYADKLISSKSEVKDLKDIASAFYKEGNLGLSESIYDVYIERISASYPKEELISDLTGIAKEFAYSDEGKSDTSYAEKLFKRIEEIGVKEAFDEGLTYLRGFNLEKAKEFPAAADIYIDLLKRFPRSAYGDELKFKIGLIHIYVLRNAQSGKDYFRGLAKNEDLSPQVISSLYQLGLLAQWEEDLPAAREYYNKLLERGSGDFQETASLAKARLSEIDGLKPIEYNLKAFLDIALPDENKIFNMEKIDLKARPYKADKDTAFNISAAAYTGESGCMQVELQYLWSGDLGSTQPANTQPSFLTRYLHSGSKVINLVVVSPSGILDRSIDIVDVE